VRFMMTQIDAWVLQFENHQYSRAMYDGLHRCPNYVSAQCVLLLL